MSDFIFHKICIYSRIEQGFAIFITTLLTDANVAPLNKQRYISVHYILTLTHTLIFAGVFLSVLEHLVLLESEVI